MMKSSPRMEKTATPVLVFAVVLLMGACSTDATNPSNSASAGRYGNPPTWIEVTPASSTVPQAGTDVVLSVEVRDSKGKEIRNPRVSWTSLNPSVADVDAGGRVRTYGKGTAQIIAEASPVADTVTVTVAAGAPGTATVRISPRADTIPNVGGGVQLSVAILDAAGNPVPGAVPVWDGNDPSVATVSATGFVLGQGSGQLLVFASHGGQRDSIPVWVAPPPPPASLEVTPVSDSIYAIGGTKQYVATVRDADGNTLSAQGVAWQSLNPSVATVDANGRAMGLAKGHGRLVATLSSLADTADVYVDPPASAARIEITPAADTIPAIGNTIDLTAVVYDDENNPMSGAGVTWTSLDPAAAIVGPGKVAGVSKGIARITAMSGSLADTALVWVAPAPAGSPNVQLVISPEPMMVENLDIIWKFSAKLDSAGTLTDLPPATLSTSDWGTVRVEGPHASAVKNGRAHIIATYNGMADSVLVTVGPASTSSVSIPYGTGTLAAAGDTVQLTAHVLDDAGNPVLLPTVTWTSLEPSIATVTGHNNGTAKVTAVAGGTARIVASRGSISDTATVNVTAAPPSSSVTVQVNPATDTIQNVGGTTLLAATVRDAQGNLDPNQSVTWTSLNPGVASVNASGLVTGLSQGTAQIQASQGSASATATVWVDPQSGGPPQSGQTVDLHLVRWTGGSGSVLVSSGIPLPPGALYASQLNNLVVYVSGQEQSLYVEALSGRHPDGSLRSVLVQFSYAVPSSGLNAQLVLGPGVSRTTPDRAFAATSVSYTQPLPAASALPSSPSYLVSTEIVGKTMVAPSSFSSLWESNFTTWGDPKWQTMLSEYGSSLDVNKVTTYNYYDRALANYAWWVRTGNPEYWKRASYYVLAYRDVYMKPNNYRAQPHNVQIEGMELHYLLTGDPEALRGARLTIESFDGWMSHIGDNNSIYTEGRIQARTLDALLTGYRMGLTSRNFESLARQALTSILSTQGTDGAYRFQVTCGEQLNYMTGLVNEVFIKYHEYFEADARIPGAIRKSLDFLWNTQWLATDGAFKYVSGSCSGVGGPTAAPDLNLLLANGFVWYASQSGDGSYRTKGDQVFNQGVLRAWLHGQKQFNESYRSSFHYESYR